MIITLTYLKDLAGKNQLQQLCNANQSHLTYDIKIVDHIICQYENHPSVRHIKKNIKTSQNSTCSLLTISEQEVKQILKELSIEKSTGVDMMPPKSVKLAVNYLRRPLS